MFNLPDHMTKMAAMPIYGNNMQLGMQHGVLQYYHDYSNDKLGLLLTFLRQLQIWENARTYFMESFESMA